MKLSAEVGTSPVASIEFRGNAVVVTSRILLDGRTIFWSWQLAGPDHATSGGCPGEVEVSESMPTTAVHEWSFPVGDSSMHRVVIRRKSPRRFPLLRRRDYELEVDGQIVRRAYGY